MKFKTRGGKNHKIDTKGRKQSVPNVKKNRPHIKMRTL